MNSAETKIVLIIDDSLPVGLIANTAAVLALTLGQRQAELIGPDIVDGSGLGHVGITTVPLPILKASAEAIRELREQAAHQNLLVVDFSDIAQTTHDYAAYTAKLLETPAEELRYLGIAICGARKAVSRLTGEMPLLR